MNRAAAALGLCLAVLAGLPAAAQAAGAGDRAAEVSEERVEAAYLYKFLNYAEWPPASFPQPDTPYVIGIAGDDAVAAELARIAAGRSVNNRGVIVKRVLPGEALDGIHLLFVGHAERLAQWVRQVRGRPVLTVTNADGALEQGSIINFRSVDQRIRFEVSVDAAEQNAIHLNSRLFSVATNVVKGSH